MPCVYVMERKIRELEERLRALEAEARSASPSPAAHLSAGWRSMAEYRGEAAVVFYHGPFTSPDPGVAIVRQGYEPRAGDIAWIPKPVIATGGE